MHNDLKGIWQVLYDFHPSMTSPPCGRPAPSSYQSRRRSSFSTHLIVNVPVGFNRRGRPMGMQIIGPAAQDMAVLQPALIHESRCDPGVARGEDQPLSISF